MMHDTKLVQFTREGDLTMVKKLIASGCNVNTKNSFDENLLFIACENAHEELALFLLENHANALQINSAGQTVFFAACKGGNLAIVKKLISLNQIDTRKSSRSGSYPLRVAVEYGHLNIIKYLNEQEFTPPFITPDNVGLLFSHAVSKGRKNIISYFLEKKLVSISMLEEISWHFYNGNAEEIVRSVIFSFNDLTFKVVKNMANDLLSMCNTSSDNNQAALVFLLERYPKLSNSFGDFFDALFTTVSLDSDRSAHKPNPNNNVSFLLKHGLNFDTLNQEGQTLLHYAATHYIDEYDNFYEVSILLHLGYPIDILNAKGQTPLIAAIEAGLSEHAYCLIENGASLDIKDKQGKTALDYANNFLPLGWEDEDEEDYIAERKDLIDTLTKPNA